MSSSLLTQLKELIAQLRTEKRQRFKRQVSVGDLLTERDENARAYGFGEGTTCYDNVLILGDVKVGKHTWIGPGVILDGSGGTLTIGDYCSISSGVHIYTHNTVEWSTSMGKVETAKAPTRVGSGVYIGPQSVISMGLKIGDRAVIGAMSFVDRDIPEGARAWGVPARVRP